VNILLDLLSSDTDLSFDTSSCLQMERGTGGQLQIALCMRLLTVDIVLYDCSLVASSHTGSIITHVKYKLQSHVHMWCISPAVSGDASKLSKARVI
jgi:hypothetical protein